MSGLLVGMLLLSGCQRDHTSPPIPTNFMQPPTLAAQDATGTECGALALAAFRGQHYARLADHPMQGVLRILHPLQPMTMDFSPSRLNVRVDSNGRIGDMFCG